MSKIQQAFDAGNFALVRRLATPKEAVLLNKIQTDPKIIWAGLFGLASVLLTALYALELIR